MALGEDGNVSLECKVIGIPQPTLTWFKDGKELRAGDLHQLTSSGSSSAEACVFGTYKCLAENCMGGAASEATLVGIDDETTEESATAAVEAVAEARHEVVDDLLEDIDVSAAFATANEGANGKSVMLSMADVPDISAHDAKQIVQMFAEELAETITGSSIGDSNTRITVSLSHW